MTEQPCTAVIAVDGPSGSGKSTVSRRLARRLGVRYLDTGAMYRALTWAVLRAGVDPADAAAVREVLGRTQVQPGTDPAAPSIAVSGTPVDGPVREQPVTAAVSAVAAIPAVRTALVAQQREIIGAGGIVVEGRDIGAVVAPGADLKVFLTADPSARADRRSAERRIADTAGTRADLYRRDSADHRTNPLRPAPGAVTVDTTELSVDAVVDRLAALLQASQG